MNIDLFEFKKGNMSKSYLETIIEKAFPNYLSFSTTHLPNVRLLRLMLTPIR